MVGARRSKRYLLGIGSEYMNYRNCNIDTKDVDTINLHLAGQREANHDEREETSIMAKAIKLTSTSRIIKVYIRCYAIMKDCGMERLVR